MMQTKQKEGLALTYEAFLAQLMRNYVEPRAHAADRGHWHQGSDEPNRALSRLTDGARVARFALELPGYDGEALYHTFQPGALANAVRGVRTGMSTSRMLAEESGILQVVEDYFPEIVAGLTPKALPKEDARVLDRLGSRDPSGELAALIYLLKARSSQLAASMREVSLRAQIENLENRLEEMAARLESQDEEDQKPKRGERPGKPGRRWWKGLGQIAQGSGLTLVNIALLVGALPGLSVDEKTYGALASAATGLGTVLVGIGDLRGE